MHSSESKVSPLTGLPFIQYRLDKSEGQIVLNVPEGYKRSVYIVNHFGVAVIKKRLGRNILPSTHRIDAKPLPQGTYTLSIKIDQLTIQEQLILSA